MIVWRDVFLGVIAVATLAMAVVQIAVIIAAASAAKRLGEIADTFEREVRPLVDGSKAISADSVRKINEITTRLDNGIVTRE